MVIDGSIHGNTKALEPSTKKRALSVLGALFWIAVFSAQLWFLVGDVTLFGPPPARAPNAADSDPVADLVAVTHEVRLKEDQDVVWSETRGGESLRDGQFVMTLDASAAEVAFADGAGLVIGENSLVQIRRPVGENSNGIDVPLLVSLVRGTIRKAPAARGAAGTAMAIQVGQTRVRFAPESELSLTVASSGKDYTVQVSQGEVEIEGGKAPSTAKAGEQISLSSDGARAEVKLLPIAPTAPANQSVLALDRESVEVVFEWKAVKSDSAFTVEISRSADFGPGSRTISTEETAAKADFALERDAGLWHWRVKESGGEASPTQRFWLRSPPRPELAYPNDGAVLKAGEDVAFSWSVAEGGARDFELLLEAEEDGKSRTLRAGENSLRVPELPPGTYRWKVRASGEKGAATPWSRARALRVVAELPSKLPPPKALGKPKFFKPKFVPRGKDRSSIERAAGWFASLVFGLEARAEEAAEWDVALEWSAVEGAEKYKVQVSRSRGFRDLLTEAEVAATRWTWRYRLGMENTKGRLFYRVAAVGIDGELGEFSDPIPLEVPSEIREAKAGKPKAKASPAPRVPPPAASAATVRSEPPRPPAVWALSAGFGFRFGTFTQTSEEARLTGVSADAWFPHQGIRLAASRTRDGEGFRLALAADLSQFASSESQGLAQPEARAADLSLWGFHVSRPEEPGSWRMRIGGVARRANRWERVSDEAVASVAGYSVGPAVALEQDPSGAGTRLFVPDRIRVAAGAPFVGTFLGQFWGVQAEAFAGWDVFRVSGVPVELRIQADYDLTFWKDPVNTSISRFSASLGLTAALSGKRSE